MQQPGEPCALDFERLPDRGCDRPGIGLSQQQPEYCAGRTSMGPAVRMKSLKHKEGWGGDTKTQGGGAGGWVFQHTPQKRGKAKISKKK
jgi:hypothetical protein